MPKNMPKNKRAASLAKFKLFENLASTDLLLITEHLDTTTLPAGRILFTHGQLGEEIYFLVRGSVKVCIEESDGTDLLLAIYEAGKVLGEDHAVDGLGYSATAITLERCEFLSMNRLSFCHCLDTMPVLGRNLSNILAQRSRHATAQIRVLAHLDIPGRVAYQLLLFAKSSGQATSSGEIILPLQIRQGDLASLVGATRESVNKALAAFRQNGLITFNKYRIILHDPEALQRQLR